MVISHSILMEDSAFTLVEFALFPMIEETKDKALLKEIDFEFNKAIKRFTNGRLHSVYSNHIYTENKINSRLVKILNDNLS